LASAKLVDSRAVGKEIIQPLPSKALVKIRTNATVTLRTKGGAGPLDSKFYFMYSNNRPCSLLATSLITTASV